MRGGIGWIGWMDGYALRQAREPEREIEMGRRQWPGELTLTLPSLLVRASPSVA